MKIRNLLALFILLFFLRVPAFAQEATLEPSIEATVTAIETSAIVTTNTVINGLFLLVAVLVISLLAIVFIVLRNQAQKGNEQAAQVLGIISTVRDMAFPKESTEARLKAFKEDVKQTPGFLDDFAAMLIDAGWHVISPTQAPPVVAQTSATTGTGYTITGNQDGVTITADTSPTPYGVSASGTPLGKDLTTTPAQVTPLPGTGRLPTLTDLHEPGVPSGGAEEFRP